MEEEKPFTLIYSRNMETVKFSSVQFISHDKIIYKHYNSMDRNKMPPQFESKTYTNSVKLKLQWDPAFKKVNFKTVRHCFSKKSLILQESV